MGRRSSNPLPIKMVQTRQWTGLACMGGSGVVERARQERPVDVGLVRLDLGDQLVDEVLMSFEYRH